jgi:hypothetical protein
MELVLRLRLRNEGNYSLNICASGAEGMKELARTMRHFSVYERGQ